MMNSMDGSGAYVREDSLSSSMPPPMRELNPSSYPPGIMTPRGDDPMSGGRFGSAGGGGTGSGTEDFFSPSNEYYGSDQGDGAPGPGRGQRLLHRMASDSARYGRSRMQQSSMQSPTAVNGSVSRRSYTLQYPNGRHNQYGSSSSRAAATMGSGMSSSSHHHHRSRHYSGLEYASDTEALHSPASVSSMRISRAIGRSSGGGASSFIARSSSLPRTFQREALLRHPELSMEMDRLAQATDPAALLSGLSTDDQLSDSGAVSAPESVITARKRGEIKKAKKIALSTVT